MRYGGFVYIMTNKPMGVLYIGVTNDMAERVVAHREGRGSTFCKRYNCTRLVMIEPYPTIVEAITRKKAMKEWQREWKLRLIGEANPEWSDLFETLNA